MLGLCPPAISVFEKSNVSADMQRTAQEKPRPTFKRRNSEMRGRGENRTLYLFCNNVDPISSGTFDLASNCEASKERSTFASL